MKIKKLLELEAVSSFFIKKACIRDQRKATRKANEGVGVWTAAAKIPSNKEDNHINSRA